MSSKGVRRGLAVNVDLARLTAAIGLSGLLAAALSTELLSQARGAAESRKIHRYRPTERVPPSLDALQKQLVPGGDAFPDEKEAHEIAHRLAEYGQSLKERLDGAAAATDALLAQHCKGARLTSADEQAIGAGSLQIFRSQSLPSEPTLGRTELKAELATVLSDFASLETAEFLITAIEVNRRAPASALTTIRFDLVGASKQGGRAERVGHWRVRWVPAAKGAWSVSEWTARDYVRSRSAVPIFTETTDDAFGGNPSFRRQLVPGLDYWAAHLDAIFTPRGMGHHGVSVGDIDGDGLDDVYVAQPDGLPNRLFRNTGNGTFEDVTETSGVAVLDRTSQSLFADVDNDDDQDLILLARTGPALFVNDGKGRFTRRAEAFQFSQPLQGSLTSAAMADFDRDGFLDLYLCTYGYFIGVSEDKAGPPSPYHDAQNGSPDVLLRNDGHGRFIDVTPDIALENNDRFSFAAAWSDYDEDGWPDLLVANDFGRKNLYRNLGLVDGRIRFRDVAREAGVEDYGAGMSAAFVDYDNDGKLDIYTGNMWTSAGQRVTAAPGFKPDASSDIREVYRRHARGNALFRNRGDGTFEDVTLHARAAFGRWAWSSDVLDFDSDGFQDLYVANGMFTRDDGEPSIDVDSFFWRQVVAQSPLTRTPGTPYDDGWRLTNRLLVADGAQAQHERNVLLRNDGRGGFDEVSGTSGVDLDQDGRAFGVFDYDADGDPDLVMMAPRSSPQLRLFRNDFAPGHASMALRLRGSRSNRDAVGARVTIETDHGRFTRVVTGGSGFLSQHSKELVIGLGRSQRFIRATIVWPSGTVQTLSGLPLNQRTWVEEGVDAVRSEPFKVASRPAAPARRTRPKDLTAVDSGIWLHQPFPAPDFALRGFDGSEYSLAGLAGRPVVICFWASWAPPSVATIQDLSKQQRMLTATGASVLAVAVDAPADEPTVKSAAAGVTVPLMIAGEEMAGTYNVLHRYLFDRRENLGVPTAFLIDGRSEIVKVYKAPIDASQIVQDLGKLDMPEPARLTRAMPFPGTFLGTLGERSYFQYGLELSEQGFDAPALAAFERVARTDPTAIAFYNLGTLYMKRGKTADAKGAFERALQLKADYADAHNSLGALLAQNGDLAGATAQFEKALAARPQFADAMNNLGYALFQAGDAARARELYEEALALQPGFPEALNNLGIFYGTQRDLDRALTYFERALHERSTYGDAANNLALVLSARGETDKAVDVLRRLLQVNPGFEMGYVTLCRIYLRAGQVAAGTQVLEQLLQRNPTHPLGLQLLQQIRAGG